MLINTKTVIKYFQIVISNTICILMEFKMAVIKFTVDGIQAATKLARNVVKSL